MPERRDLALSNLDEVVKDVDALHANGYEKAGDWDLAQCCSHLCVAMNGAVDGASISVPWYMKIIGPLFIKRSFFKSREIRPGLPAPDGTTTEPGGDEAEQVQKLRDTVAKLKAHTGEYQPHPFFGKLTRDETQQFHVIHAQHHLSFLVPKA